MHYRFTPDESGLGQSLDLIEQRLTSYGLKRKEIAKSMLAAEEVMSALLEYADNADYLHLSVRRILDEISIEIAVPGREFAFENGLNVGISADMEEVGPETERAIRSMILKSFVDDLKYRHRAGMNTVRISVL